jgi:chromosomal replication initiation ATPase DnaA
VLEVRGVPAFFSGKQLKTGTFAMDEEPTAATYRLTMKEMLQRFAAIGGVSYNGLIRDVRTKHYVVPRQAAMLALREVRRLTFPQIGSAMRRDHTTILHGCNVARKRVKASPEFRALFEQMAEVCK